MFTNEGASVVNPFQNDPLAFVFRESAFLPVHIGQCENPGPVGSFSLRRQRGAASNEIKKNGINGCRFILISPLMALVTSLGLIRAGSKIGVFPHGIENVQGERRSGHAVPRPR
jgi:hypothetical protein